MPISTSDLHQLAEEQNPWRRDGTVPTALAPPVSRPLAQVLWRKLLDDQPRRFQVILGPRRVGKTTVLYQTVQQLLRRGIAPRQIWWWRLDHPALASANLGELAKAALAGVAERPVFLMLDEVVYGKDWDRWLKTFHDERWPVRVAATASATAALRDRAVESGVGRWTEQHLMPYQFGEFLDLLDHESPAVTTGETLADTLRSLAAGTHADQELQRLRNTFLIMGGFPELLVGYRAAQPDDLPALLIRSQRLLRSDAVERSIYKDIPQSFGVESPVALERLLYALAGQCAGLLAPAHLAHDLGLSQPTIDRYIAYLERTFLTFTLPNYSGAETKIQRRRRKLYFVDGAVRNAALQRGLAPLDDGNELGMLRENLVAASLHALALRCGVRLHHWRANNHEVDLLYGDPRAPLAFEVASSLTHPRSGLAALTRSHAEFRGRCYLVAPQAPVVHPDAATPGTLPLDTLLLAIYAQGNAELGDAAV